MIYYIDYENVGVKGLQGISTLSYNDKVVILIHLATNVKTLVSALKDTEAKIYTETFHAHTKNALDFTMAVRIGNDMSKSTSYKKPFHCVIVSNDKGFTAIRDRVMKSGGYCTIQERITSDNQIMGLLSSVLSNCSKKYIKKVKNIMLESNDIIELNNNIMKDFKGTENGLFHKIKPIYQSIN